MKKLEEVFRSWALPRTELSNENAELLIRLLSSKDLDEPLSFSEFLAHPNISGLSKEAIPQGIMALWTRVNRLNGHFKMSLNGVLYLSLFVRTFGDSTLYFSYTAHKAKEKGVYNITLSFIAEHVFPFGMFSDEQLSDMWAAQKNNDSPNSNLLDDGAAWREYLYGEDNENKIMVRYPNGKQIIMTPEEVFAIGEPKNRTPMEDRIHFRLGEDFVSVHQSEFSKLEK